MVRFLLPQRQRLKRKNHFQSFFAQARFADSRYFRLYYAPKLLDYPAVAFVANKKTGNSPHRNLCKRRLKESYRLLQHEVDSAFDFVWVAKRALVDSDTHVVQQTAHQLLKAKGLIQQ